MYTVIYSVSLLLLKVVSLDAFAPWPPGVGLAVEKKNTKHNGEPKDYEVKFIVQRLDHFDDKENRTFTNLYLQDISNFHQNGPIYLYLSRTLPAQNELPSLMANKLAIETHGAVIVPEIRYYGSSSRPLNISDTKNLKYMTSQQVLADMVHLIKTIKSQPTFKSSKVVVMGGAYGGGLAAEMRYKYPDVVDCAWVSSAAYLAKTNFYEFLEQVGKNYLTYGSKQCYDAIVQRFNDFQTKFQTAEGIKQLKKDFHICESSDMTKHRNQQRFYALRTWYFSYTAAYESADEMNDICNDITNGPDDAGISKVTHLMKNGTCSDLEFNNFFTSDPDPQFKVVWYSWCTEYGYTQTTDSNDQPFGKHQPLEYYISICQLLLGPHFNKSTLDHSVAYHNKYYGGQTPKMTNAIFLNYVQDPFRLLGITKSLNDDAPAVMIDGSYRTADLYEPDPEDSKSLTKARDYAEKMVKYWVGLGPRPAPYNTTIVHEQNSI
ncbi:serine carboxypeptidase s28 domain-containing protein [Phthorimaea operculella]|nr:serine carboxypeptidase s28 domain-containing protein [Phthorimaea operculella]